MNEAWHQLYVRSSSAPDVERTLVEVLTAHGYQRYDPFPGGSGTPPGLTAFVRHFVAPPEEGWVCVLGYPAPEPLPALLHRLSVDGVLLHAWFSGAKGGIDPYRDGAPVPEGLAAFLRPGKSAEDLARVDDSAGETAETPALLPGELERLARAHNVRPAQASRLINRLSGQLFGKLSRASGGEAGDMQAQARAMLSGSGGPDWHSAGARRVAALADLLHLPKSWRAPDFETVRDAYHVVRRLRRNPNAALLPDEQEALDRLPRAGEYFVVYAGK